MIESRICKTEIKLPMTLPDYLSKEEFESAVRMVMMLDRWDRERRLREAALFLSPEVRESPLKSASVSRFDDAFSGSWPAISITAVR